MIRTAKWYFEREYHFRKSGVQRFVQAAKLVADAPRPDHEKRESLRGPAKFGGSRGCHAGLAAAVC